MWPDEGLLDECAAYGTGCWLIVVESHESFDAVIAEEMLVGTCYHGPLAEDMVGFEADVTLQPGGTLSDGQFRCLQFFFVVVG